MREYTGKLCDWDTDVFVYGDLGCLPGNLNKVKKHKKMLISLKAISFNFLKIPFHVYFSFPFCFCFSFPCIIFCPIIS